MAWRAGTGRPGCRLGELVAASPGPVRPQPATSTRPEETGPRPWGQGCGAARAGRARITQRRRGAVAERRRAGPRPAREGQEVHYDLLMRVSAESKEVWWGKPGGVSQIGANRAEIERQGQEQADSMSLGLLQRKIVETRSGQGLA